MRITLLITCFAFLAAMAEAQHVQTRTFSLKKDRLSYAYFCESESPKGLLVAFMDSTSGKWTAASWCQELFPIAEKNEWALIVPALWPWNERSQAMVMPLVTAYRDSVESDRVRFVSSGAGWTIARPLLQAAVPGLIISPQLDSLGLMGLGNENVAMAIHASARKEQARALGDSLAQLGLWLRFESVTADDPYYVDNHYEVYDNLLLWVDSMQAVLQDSVQLISLERASGLKSEVPDVLKQGQRIELEIWVSQPGKYNVQVLDLSSHAVYEERLFFGKGRHTVVVPTKDLNWGVYHLEIIDRNIKERHKFMIRG